MTIHWRPDSDRPRSAWIDGSATFTIVASRITMNCARQTSTRTSQGLTPCARAFTFSRLPARARTAVRVPTLPRQALHMELIHACYRITDPERSFAFYEALGLESAGQVL